MIGKCEDVLADTIVIPDTANPFCNQMFHNISRF